MKVIKNGKLVYFECKKLSENYSVIHAFCSRKGGLSSPPFDSLNLSYRVGDRDKVVSENYKIVGKNFGINHEHFITVNQPHGDGILVIDSQPESIKNLSDEAKKLKKDALITDKPFVPIGILTADCASIIFFDKKRKVIAIAHAGWRGTILRIGQKVFAEMKRLYGTIEENCLVSISPSIKKCCYEVGEEVLENLKINFPEWTDFVVKKGNKWNFSIDELNIFQMIEIGIPLRNISKSNLCTSCNRDLFFSYRAESGITGRSLSFIMLKNSYKL